MDRLQPRFGVLLPTREVVLAGRTDPSVVYDLAERAEALGFHSVWVGDSVIARPRLDALTTLAAVGARTQRVRIGTAVYLAALREPILVARAVATVDWLSRGRLDLGIGYGRRHDPAQEREYRALGRDPSKRIKISEEAVRIMRKLWSEDEVSYAGECFALERITLHPKPVQPGGVPIWLAANDVEPGLRRVARMADGWLNNITDPKVYARCLGRIRDYAYEAGRDPLAIEPGLYCTIAAGDEAAIAEGRKFLSLYYDRPYDSVANAMLCLMGGWDSVLDGIETYVGAGARTFVLRFATADQMSHLETCAEYLSRRGWMHSGSVR